MYSIYLCVTLVAKMLFSYQYQQTQKGYNVPQEAEKDI